MLGKTRQVLKIDGIFAVYREENYKITFGISGWSHTVGE